MVYRIGWYRENRVMLITMEGVISAEELAQIETESLAIAKSATGIVHAIVDMREMDATSQNLRSSFSGMTREKHPNQGISVIVLPNMNTFAKFVTSTLMQMLRLQYRLCDTMAEAESIIDRIDVRLNN